MNQNRKYKVIVSDRAKRMLGEHIRFMAQVNKEAAAAKKKEIMTALRSLSRLPQRFPFFEELYIPPNKYHRMFIEKWYLVLYQIQDDTVYIDYILDCRKDYSWLIRYVAKWYRAKGVLVRSNVVFDYVQNRTLPCPF